MKELFDRVVDRRDTASLKYSFLEKEGLASDTLPMWVADMDFETVPEVKECLTNVEMCIRDRKWHLWFH